MESKPYEEIIEDKDSLGIFVDKMREFNGIFCREMMNRTDFTIRLEVRGNQGNVLHVRVYHDTIGRPVQPSKS